MEACSTPELPDTFVQLGVKKCVLRSPTLPVLWLTVCIVPQRCPGGGGVGGWGRGGLSNKINYQVAAQRAGRSSGCVSLYRLRCGDAAALINQRHKPALTIAHRASSLLSCPSCKMRRRHRGAAGSAAPLCRPPSDSA